jgi:membrane dipeptidase
MLIIDSHVDLAWNALQFGRDYTHSVQTIRQAESGTATVQQVGLATLGLPEWQQAQVAIMFATIFVVPAHRAQAWDTQVYRTPAQAAQLALKQIDYYQRLCDTTPTFRIIRTQSDLNSVLQTWQPPHLPANRQIGLVLLMEGADPIVEPKAVAEWFERGVRVVGPAWVGTRYSGGTGEPGELTNAGVALLHEMAIGGLMLDISHQCQRSSLQAMDLFTGAVCATHANPRAIATPKICRTRPERHANSLLGRARRCDWGDALQPLFANWLERWTE